MNTDDSPGLDRHILRMAVDLSPSSILITDHRGRIEFVNPRLCELTGYGRDELLGQNPRLLRSGRTSSEEYRRLWDTITSGAQWSGIFCNRRKSGDLYWEAARISPVTGPDGNITHYLGIKEDITPLKRLEDDLLQAQKTGYVGRLASGIAHDFNNLLSAILGFGAPVQRALKGTRLGDDLGRVISAAERATELARNLFVLGAHLPALPQLVELGPALRSMVPLLHHLLGRQVRLDLDFDDRSRIVLFDPVQLQQVILSLLASRQDSFSHCRSVRITTATEEVDHARVLALDQVCPGRFARIDIVAEGVHECPVGPEPSAVSILRNHGGFFEETGSNAISLFLPLAQASTPPPATAFPATASAPDSASAKSVLVVEDEALVSTWISRVLQSAGYSPILATSAEQAFELLAASETLPSAIVTDLGLPGLNGLKLVERLRETLPQLRAICITGSTPPDTLPPGVSMLQKPFSPEELLERLTAPLPASKGVVLVVDDDENLRYLLRTTLERAGYTVFELNDGANVEAELAARPFDLIITDLVMPQREGLEVVRAVRRLFPSLHVIATSGAFGGYFLEVARKLGAESVLSKPLRPEAILACVEEVLGRPIGDATCH